MRLVCLALLLLATGLVQAANQATVSWVYDEAWPGSTLTFTVYQAEKGQPKLPVSTGLTAKTVTYTSGFVTGKAYCWHVTAVVDGRESVPSGEACLPFPSPPTSLIAK